MPALSLAFVWHQHQPYYMDDLAGYAVMPWVRLHGAKDYWGMAMHLREVPELRATVNLAPSLLKQLAAYGEHRAMDEHLRVSRLAADSLNAADVAYLLDNFFMVQPERMIRPYRRYQALYEQRGFGVDGAHEAARRFTQRDLLDLQVWNNLVWIHPIAMERDADLAELRRKGEGFTESEKHWLLDRQLALVAEVIPLHKELADRGQIELITTPFYHPILPLLCDKRLARQAMPDVVLPQRLESYAEDATAQARRAIDFHEQIFGRKPRGMWPAEGAVAQAIMPLIAATGVEWIASDEQVLSASLHGAVGRDAQGYLRSPELLYQPWNISERGKRLQMIFRDHALSDAIGFHYSRYPARQAADEFLGKLEGIRQCDFAKNAARPALVSVILDGDNCWEHYPGGGVEFLRTLYRRLAGHPHIETTRVSDYLDAHPATGRIGQLFAGSWINHNFGIWIGHGECNSAWDLVSKTREFLVGRSQGRRAPSAALERAWEELYIAQGSDWFWWFGDSHWTAHGQLFDELFRKHLRNAYALLGEQAPGELARPIRLAERDRLPYTQPTSLLNVRVDGRHSYFEWLNAGCFETTAARGTMSMVDTRRIAGVYFGFDEQRFLVRLDTREGPARLRLADVDTLRIVLPAPTEFELVISNPSEPRPEARLFHRGVPVSSLSVEAASDAIVEVAAPWRLLGLATGDALQFFVEALAGEHVLERAPRDGVIETCVPSPYFELMMWQA